MKSLLIRMLRSQEHLTDFSVPGLLFKLGTLDECSVSGKDLLMFSFGMLLGSVPF